MINSVTHGGCSIKPQFYGDPFKTLSINDVPRSYDKDYIFQNESFWNETPRRWRKITAHSYCAAE